MIGGSLIGLIGGLIILGVLVWAAQRILAVIPLAEPFRTIVYVLIVVLVVVWCVNLFLPLIGGHPFLTY